MSSLLRLQLGVLLIVDCGAMLGDEANSDWLLSVMSLGLYGVFAVWIDSSFVSAFSDRVGDCSICWEVSISPVPNMSQLRLI